MKLEVQHRAGARIITGCTKSTPVSALMRESDLLPLADKATSQRPDYMRKPFVIARTLALQRPPDVRRKSRDERIQNAVLETKSNA